MSPTTNRAILRESPYYVRGYDDGADDAQAGRTMPAPPDGLRNGSRALYLLGYHHAQRAFTLSRRPFRLFAPQTWGLS